jgi:hypothetical protein
VQPSLPLLLASLAVPTGTAPQVAKMQKQHQTH